MFDFRLLCIESLLFAFSLILPSVVFNSKFWETNQQLEPSLSDHQIRISHALPSKTPATTTLTLRIHSMDFVTWTKYVGQFEYSEKECMSSCNDCSFFTLKPIQNDVNNRHKTCQRRVKSTLHDIDNHMQFEHQHVKPNLQNAQNYRKLNRYSSTIKCIFQDSFALCSKLSFFSELFR